LTPLDAACPAFQVDFTEALDLVKNRRVYVSGGQAYVPRQEILSIIAGAFRARLSGNLTATAKALPNLEEDSRLLPMLGNLSKQYLGNDYGTSDKKTGHVTAADVPSLAEESFPMCMRHSHTALTDAHHLKHGARMQYGLFLKGIGMKLEDAMLFWRTEFLKSMGGDKFEKNYAYNIRHNYGKEGKRTDYTPYSCMKIIMSNAPATGDAHGCPFRHFEREGLRLRMHQYKVPAKAIDEISNLVKDSHYQLACVRYFEVTHKVDQADFVLQHPNQYFEKSRELRTGEKMDTAGAASGGAAAVTSSPTSAAQKETTPEMAIEDDDLAAMMEL
jgi:DNA primase large subunit